MTPGGIGVGILGTGRIAEMVHVSSLRLCPHWCEISAVASRTLNRFAGVKEPRHCPTQGSSSLRGVTGLG